MPRNVRWKGQTLVRPGSYTYTDLAGLINLDLGADAAIIVVGEADAGQPQPNAANPVYHAFTDPQDMIDTFLTGKLAEVAQLAFDPALGGQDEDGIPIRGCDTVYAIKTNQSTQAEATPEDGSANDAFTIKDRIWGLKGNQTWWKIETDGTGIKIVIGRENAPNIGEQDSSDTDGTFSVTGVDEWIQLGITGAFTGTSCTVAFDGTTLTFDSDVAAEDLAITCTGKTVAEVVQEINAFAPLTTAAYSATVLRAARQDVLFTYLDEFLATSIFAADVSFMGVSYDMVTWLNANSAYVEATWVGGFEPQTSTLAYLTGGTTGDTTAATLQDAFKVAKRINCRFIVLASNAAIGSGGSIALSTQRGYFETHLNQCNPLLGRSERQGFACSDETTKATLWTALQLVNNPFLSVVQDEVRREGPDGVITWLGAHCSATMAAAIMAGSPIATPLTLKYCKVYDSRPVATDFDPDDNTDYTNAINNGLLFLEQIPGEGTRFAKGISTYKTEDNDGYIMLEVVEAWLWLSRLYRRNLERPYTGHKGRGVRTVNQARGAVRALLRAVSDPNSPDFLLIEGTDDQGNVVPPFRNLRVWNVGDQLYTSVEVTFTQGINFLLNELRATLPTALSS